MVKAIRNLGSWTLGLGVLEIFFFGSIDPTTGILLIIVGLISIWFRTPDIFPVFAITLIWSAIYNFSTMKIGWMLIGLFKAYLVFNAFQSHRRYRGIDGEHDKLVTNNTNNHSAKKELTASFLPWVGFLLSFFSAIGVVFSAILGAVITSATGSSTPPSYFIFLVSIISSSGILGFSFSLSSLISDYKPKLIVIIGMVLGGIMLLFFLTILVTS